MGVEAEAVDSRRLRELEPNLRPGLVGGFRVPGDSVVYPPTASAALIERAQAQGARFDMGAPVRAISGAWVEREDGSRIEGDLVVNAAGARAGVLTPGLPIRPRKGHLVITDRHPGFVRPPDPRAGLPEIRPRVRSRLGRLQCPAPRDRATPHRLVGGNTTW